MNLTDELIKEGYPSDIAKLISAKYDEVKGTKLEEFFEKEAGIYAEKKTEYDLKSALPECNEIAYNEGISSFFANYMLVRSLLPVLARFYREKELDDSFIMGVRDDLKAKCYECYKVKGEVGTFVADWYKGFFALRIFPIGRLQYEMSPVPYYETESDVNYSGRKAINIHIPSLGKLDINDVKASIAKAAEFFADEFRDDDEILLRCKSWLLFPANKEMLPPESGICRFADLFEIVNVYEYETGKDLWRIFDTDEVSDISKLDSSTALRRGYIKLLSEGKPTGGALGIIKIKNNFGQSF